ncbi:heme peroxidase-domain-containing protein [Apiospora sp. TS-2023a]
MLVMYNRYHNYAARQLLRINENGRFSVPIMYQKTMLVSLIQECLPDRNAYGQRTPLDASIQKLCDQYETAFKEAQDRRPRDAPVALKKQENETDEERKEREATEKAEKDALDAIAKFEGSAGYKSLVALTEKLVHLLEDKKLKLKEQGTGPDSKFKEFETQCKNFEAAWEAARKKQDDDLFNTARLITYGMYIQISVHDYLRALMGFHQFNTNFTLDPRADFDQKKTSRGVGNQVTVEFNLIYRFHCAISLKDERYTEEFMKKSMGFNSPSKTSLPDFLGTIAAIKQKGARDQKRGKEPSKPWEVTFGIPDAPGPITAGENNKSKHFTRNAITNLFDDSQKLEELNSAMDDPISNFGPRNVPKCLKAVEIMGIQQARKWETGTLNDFRDFFGLPRHKTFESVAKNPEIQNALRDLYEHPDKI